MEYTLLSQVEKDARIVATMKAQQMDHFLHSANKERYEAMLSDGLPEGPFKEKIIKDLADTVQAILQVEAIVGGLETQMPDSARVQIALEHLENLPK